MIPSFFHHNDFFIDEKVQFLKFENEYKVYNNEGAQIGHIGQKLSAGQKALRLLLNKSMLPFHMRIVDMEGNTLVNIKRGWTFLMSKIEISDSNDTTLGFIKQKFKLLKPEFSLLDVNDQLIGKITGDWRAWNFDITNNNNESVGTISKKWAGVAKELFTSADKYNVSIHPDYQENNHKIVLLSAAITIDMVLKEQK